MPAVILPAAFIAGTAPRPRLRVALLTPYWGFFAGAAPDIDLAEDRARLAAELAEAIEPVAEVVVNVVLHADRPADTAIGRIREGAVDAVIVAVTMAFPPEATWRVLQDLPDLPLLVWAARRKGRLPLAYTHADIATDGATVGAPQLTSLLVRAGRPFDMAAAALDDPTSMESVRRAVAAATAAGRIRRARVGRVGRPLPGYSCVDADPERLTEALGMQIVPLTPEDYLGHYRAVGAGQVADAAEVLELSYRPPAKREGPGGWHGAVRAAVALAALVEEHGLDAGAFNCHVPELRLGPVLGFAPCLALGHCTSAGVPWTCTGDVLTAIAMLTTKTLTGHALYHELEAYDGGTGEFVIANSGEHDLTLSEPPVAVDHNPWWSGVCAITNPPAGPATLVAFAQLHDRHRFITAEGRLSHRNFPASGTSNGAFTFATIPAAAAWEGWCTAGANHHSSLTPGGIAGTVRRLAAHLGTECLNV